MNGLTKLGTAARRAALMMLCFWLTSGGLARAQSAATSPPGDVAAASDAGAVSDADAEMIPSQNLLEIIRRGGALMIPILICSFVLLVFAFERAISLRRGRVIPKPFVKRFLHQLREGQLEPAEALQRCEENGSPLAQVLGGAVRKWGRSSVEVEQAMIDAGERVTNHLRRHLRVLNGVATVSPLLGLLGTVVGMIQAFNAIANNQAMGRPELLAGGISQALLTTAAGMTVAIPALICYLYFVSCVDRRIMEIDALGQEVVQLISGDRKPDAVRKSQNSKRRDAA